MLQKKVGLAALWLWPIVGREPGNIAQARHPNYPITS
jgi:hypothetical protein